MTNKGRQPKDPVMRLAWRLNRYADQHKNPFGQHEYNTQKANDLSRAATLIRRARRVELKELES